MKMIFVDVREQGLPIKSTGTRYAIHFVDLPSELLPWSVFDDDGQGNGDFLQGFRSLEAAMDFISQDICKKEF